MPVRRCLLACIALSPLFSLQAFCNDASQPAAASAPVRSYSDQWVAVDGAGRTLQYSIIAGPLPFEDYLATVEVREDGDGCQVEWSSTFEPKGISEEQASGIIEGIYRSGDSGGAWVKTDNPSMTGGVPVIWISAMISS